MTENRSTETAANKNPWLVVTRQIALCILTVGGVIMVRFMANKVSGE